jgi:cyclase
VARAVRIPVVASGGAGCAEHLAEVVTQAGASAVLAASIFHSGQYSIAQAKRVMRDLGVAVRL